MIHFTLFLTLLSSQNLIIPDLELCNGSASDFCSGYPCIIQNRNFSGNITPVPHCQCPDSTSYTYNCAHCLNFRFNPSNTSNCTLCLDMYLDPTLQCQQCLNGPNYNPKENCSTCTEQKYNQDNCSLCALPNMNVEDNCSSCLTGYVLLVNECITPFFLNFTIYFGLIVSHVSIIVIIIVLILLSRRKLKQKQQVHE